MRFTLFRKLPIKQKLVLLSIIIVGGALFLFTLVSAFTQVRIMREAMLDNLTILSESIGDLSSAALSFSDNEGAAEILSTLKADKDIEVAAVYDLKGVVFATYFKSGVVTEGALPEEALSAERHIFFLHDNSYKLQVFQPIELNGKHLGTLFLLLNTDRMVAHLLNSVLLLLLSMVVVLAVTIVVSSRLQGLITRPLSLLAKTARNISEMGDYGIRVKKSSDDEIGQLIDDFNTMLDDIQERDRELQQHRNNLELLVEERTEELRAKRDEALAAALAKSEFLANMSHEIRTPMNGVIGVLSLLRDVPMTDEYKRLLNTATRSADSLLLIINDILDFSKIDAGKISFESITFDLRELMEETSELFVDTVNLKKLDLTCFIPTDIPCRIQGDPTRLRQILTNLLSNAVKFTDKGEVKLKVSMVRRRELSQELLFTVEDAGIGITAEVTGKLFEKFTQADGSTTRKYGGTGLGLSVCKQLVEQQGGQIGVRSRLGAGSTFWFTMPFVIIEDSCPIIPYSKLQGKSYLLVDSSMANCSIIENYLHLCDARVHLCRDAQSCLGTFAEMTKRGERIDMVLIDDRLSDMDGLQLAETLYMLYAESPPEMILMSTTSQAKAQMRKSGIRNMLLKPVRQLDLYNRLAYTSIQENAGSQYVERHNRDNIVPRLLGSVLLVDDEPINQKIAMAILQKFGLQTDVTGSGMDAVQMTSAKNYSVVLMDIQMPEMSGYEATELIRKREVQEGRNRSVIIAMTANAMESTRSRCFEAGMDDFFTKPIKPDVLAERLLPWLTAQHSMVTRTVQDESEQRFELPQTAVVINAAEGKGEGEQLWDLDTALGFVGGDEELLKDLVELFLVRHEKLLAAIFDAVRAGDAASLRDGAHAYKGAVSHFAAEEVRKLAISLEIMGKSGEITGSLEICQELQRAASQLIQELTGYAGWTSS